MADTWVIDMSHYDFPEEKASEIPRAAIRLAEYFASIVEATVYYASMVGGPIGVRCRRRPGRKSCPGVIHSELHPNRNELYWLCPVCGDNGRISNWKGTRWDPSRGKIESRQFYEEKPVGKESDEELENIEGTIKWDESLKVSLPKIITAKREYSWFELGRELMTYEGFQISIKIR
jgi:hypothetical protein